MGNGVDAMRRNILFSDLPKLCKGKISGADTPSAILSLSLDSRKVFPGEGAVYFAIKGPLFSLGGISKRLETVCGGVSAKGHRAF